MTEMVAKTQQKSAKAQYYRYVPPKIPMATIRRFAQRIAERFDPEQIILFGSFAYGTAHKDSDVDFLVVMPTCEELTKAARIHLALNPFSRWTFSSGLQNACGAASLTVTVFFRKSCPKVSCSIKMHAIP